MENTPNPIGGIENIQKSWGGGTGESSQWTRDPSEVFVDLWRER